MTQQYNDTDYFALAQGFIEKSKRADDLYGLTNLFEQTIKALGCRYFVCASNVDPLNIPYYAICLTNYPVEWALHFSEQQYQKIDPIFMTSQARITPFTWSDESWRASLNFEQTKILNEASEIGLGEGFTVPIHTAEGFPASCSVVFEPGSVDPRALNCIHLMACFFYEAAMKLKVTTPLQKKPILTPRQRECLEFVAQGKSDWAISRIIGVSESTVHFHVQQTMKRLKVSTRTQAIVHALFLGEIKFFDVQISRNNSKGFINLS
ncbi:LuxR family transcriptional regulator [Paremcibacter congregatus]|uniref:LuxR family transcriptional regulator n=1 Tax=Paremcibacter congregatus TaxID=2043170 RepID=UPI0030EBFA40|tara:strand:+ start:2013 stop:2807 length:795 start_codon:yes stop_codon:yes gene_type:complete